MEQHHKYEEGDIVYDIVRPHQLMIIIRRFGIIYYCRPLEKENGNEFTYVERDLKRKHTTQVSNESE